MVKCYPVEQSSVRPAARALDERDRGELAGVGENGLVVLREEVIGETA